jgi:hypothetical protein
MPRAHGDDYDALDDFENKRAREPLPTSFLSLTQIQYALIEQWANGQFISDWPGAQPAFPVPGEITPVGLDRAALENCVGAPFVPGVEVSWLVRRPELYAEPFRLRIPPAPEKESNGSDWLKLGPLEFGPGFFSQQLALPWQADFYDCHREQHTNDDGAPMWLMWWAAQRPDDTYAPGASRQQRWVRAFDSASTAPDPDAYENLARFDQMQRRWAELRFIVRAPSGAGHELEEEP